MINFKFWQGNDIIKFYCVNELDGILLDPRPAIKHLPDWFKSVPPFLENRDQFNAPSKSAKKCFPMIDAMWDPATAAAVVSTMLAASAVLHPFAGITVIGKKQLFDVIQQAGVCDTRCVPRQRGDEVP